MKCLILILMVAMLSACGKSNSSGNPAVVDNGEVIDATITFNGSSVKISGKGICGYETFRGRIYLDFCKDQTDLSISVITNIPNFTLTHEITPQWIDITTYYQQWPIDPETMTGTIKVGGS